MSASTTVARLHHDRPMTVPSESSNPLPVLDLVVTLCRDLAEEGIRYCHWKSNEALDRSASGDNDLDLLVHRADFGRFIGILSGLGFKEARPPAVRELPGVLHYYGLDRPSGRLVHVHTQSQLILGDDMTKNYRLPVEEPYLASAVQGPLFALPAAEYELAIFVVRMVLKHATWDAIAYGRGRLSGTERRELAWLEERADSDAVLRVVQKHLPFLNEELWNDCVRCLTPEATVGLRIDTARRLRKELAGNARYSPVHDTWLRVSRRASWGTKRYVLRKRTRKQLVGGGAIIALVGGDGAGKSSAVEGVSGLLSKTFDTRQMHLGKPPRSLTSLAVKGPMYVARRFGLFPGTRTPGWSLPTDDTWVPGYDWLIWHLLNARDRHREYTRARHFAGRGGLVVSDRYPLTELSFMDGARTRAVPDPQRLRGPARVMICLERRFYDRIGYPDILIVMRVDPAIAVARRTDEPEEFVRMRNQEVWMCDWSRSPAVVVDAGQPQEQVLKDVLAIVWDGL